MKKKKRDTDECEKSTKKSKKFFISPPFKYSHTIAVRLNNVFRGLRKGALETNGLMQQKKFSLLRYANQAGKPTNNIITTKK